MKSPRRPETARQLPQRMNDIRVRWVKRSYNIFRWYRAGWGRYSQADPLLNLDNVQSVSRVLEYPLSPTFSNPQWYSYARSSPSRFIDPLGLKACPDCENATPLPSTSPKCDRYGNELYPHINTSLKCFCKCAGDSVWSQKVRGCLACEHDRHTEIFKAHKECYGAAGPDMPIFTLGKCLASCRVVSPDSSWPPYVHF